ncbi:hypothetical protein AAG570_001063 [Ranatra chinensis]|uniref:Inosine/uridine-preferring nucleoside hydrolase domain-containing protein n=1 Tax=Ranatra chinensis TaxID=642074 RepID=A0ABD0YAS5_9HEMI
MAMLMMLSSESSVDVKAITCVNGNTGLRNVTRNVLKTLTIAGRLEIPVYAGSEDAMVYTVATDSYFGEDGFGDFDFPEPNPDYVSQTPAAQALVQMVKESPGEIMLVALGPLTNVALAIHLYPSFLKELRGIVILGGSYKGGGNVKPGVEFNMYADVEAADFVFSKATKDAPIRVVPLETVEAASFPMSFRRNKLGAIPSPIMDFLNNAERIAIKKSKDTWMAFDQLTAAVVLQPSIVKGIEKREVRVETGGRYARGVWVLDNRPSAKEGPIHIVTSVNQSKFRQLLLKNLAWVPNSTT